MTVAQEVRERPGAVEAPTYDVLIIGAGFGGIGAAVALERIGVRNVVILEKWDGVGGTWWANTYPGVQVDVPSLVYSFSFDQRTEWSRLFAPGEELKAYAQEVVDKYGLRPKTRLNTEVAGMEWDEGNHLWRVTTAAGDTYTARFVIPALGGLEIAKLPEIEGIDTFGGKIMHSARWDHSYDLAGKRVAVIGTGASALQLIPIIAKEVAHLTVYQRRAIWVAPKPDWKAGPLTRFILRRRAIREVVRVVAGTGISLGTGGAIVLARPQIAPLLRNAKYAEMAFIFLQTRDRELTRKLTPDYMLGCKRPSVSNSYFPTFTRPNVELVTEPIVKGTETGLLSADGVEREFDCVICATGFRVAEPGKVPGFRVVGRDRVDLGRFWAENRFQAYQGVSVPKFPNLFMITGPYGYAPSSYHSLVEATSAHAARAIGEARNRGATRVEVRQEVHDAYWRKCLQRVERVGYQGLCAGTDTYYINAHGDVAAIRPASQFEMWWHNRHYRFSDYTFRRPPRRRIPSV